MSVPSLSSDAVEVAGAPAINRECWAVALTALGALVYAAVLPGLGLGGSQAGIVACVAAAAALSGIAGFAFSAICGAMVFQFRHDTVDIVQVMLVCSIANQSLGVWTLRREIRWRALAPYVAGGVAGVGTGIWLLLHLAGRVYDAGLGIVLLVYGTYMLFRKPIVLQRPPGLGDWVSGFAGGVLGGFAATPGAPVSIWCGLKGWDRTAQRALFQPYILVMQVFALTVLTAVHGGHGPLNGLPPLALVSVPAGLAGTWWGLNCFQRLSDRHFRVAINLLLIASGIGLAL